MILKILQFFERKRQKIDWQYEQEPGQESYSNNEPGCEFEVNEEKTQCHQTSGETSSETLSEANSETGHRLFVLSVLAIIISAFALGFAAFKSPKQNWVIVDMNQLLRQKAVSLVEEKRDVLEQREGESALKRAQDVQKEAKVIREKIEKFAANNKVIVIAKGAVFGGNLREVTDEIAATL